jgi:hypothetical protein
MDTVQCRKEGGWAAWLSASLAPSEVKKRESTKSSLRMDAKVANPCQHILMMKSDEDLSIVVEAVNLSPSCFRGVGTIVQESSLGIYSRNQFS